MELKTYFLDTYALIEIVHANPNYKKFELGSNFITSRLNLMEMHFVLLRKYGDDVAQTMYEEFLKFSIDFDDQTLMEANDFKLLNLRTRLSFVDCIGYIMAKKNNVLFVTGDHAFKNFDNVEFIK